MDRRRFGDTVLVRLERGEEILEQLAQVARAESISLASVQGLGAVDRFTVGVYNVEEQVYRSREYTGSYEIVSLTGTVDTMQGQFYGHLHMSAADGEGIVRGGHLNRATVSATCELVLRCIDGTIDRQRDAATGLNLWKF